MNLLNYLDHLTIAGAFLWGLLAAATAVFIPAGIYSLIHLKEIRRELKVNHVTKGLMKLSGQLFDANRKDNNAGILLGQKIHAFDQGKELNTAQRFTYRNLKDNFNRKFPELKQK